ncbi:MAG TPA: hypothetical protein VHU18_05515 [Rhizomicrobium sp.]|nr:hypothetical protein [Rhizomicrobium sp.]
MKKNSHLFLRTAAGILLVGDLVILADKLGKMRWFWPYDDSVFAAGLVIGIASIAVFRRAMGVELERQNNEDR